MKERSQTLEVYRMDFIMHLYANIHNILSLYNNYAKETVLIEVAISEKNSLEHLRRNVVLTTLEQLITQRGARWPTAYAPRGPPVIHFVQLRSVTNLH
ncbi:hypothetical protein EVAR_92044_1 [Eumeta japonica]|uniref:Uncharacterized protein n=1 Tax=Eumeta variegata TaxID=151549 RepID=A0A4C1T1I2_EUMVA|nr:hypothetical protein EVAR_92044_1 [Eumeta japonica]